MAFEKLARERGYILSATVFYGHHSIYPTRIYLDDSKLYSRHIFLLLKKVRQNEVGKRLLNLTLYVRCKVLLFLSCLQCIRLLWKCYGNFYSKSKLMLSFLLEINCKINSLWYA